MRKLIIAALCLAAGLAAVAIARMRSISAQAHRMVSEGAALVDVRTPEEYQAEHIPGAINVPVAEILARASEIGPPTRGVVTYCRSGGRSARAATALRSLGYTNVINLGPRLAW